MNKINYFTEKNIEKILGGNKQEINVFSLIFVGLAIISLIISIINIEISLFGFFICMIYLVYNRVNSKTKKISSFDSNNFCIVNVYCIGGNEFIKVFGNNEHQLKVKLVELKYCFSKLYKGEDIEINQPYHIVYEKQTNTPILIFKGNYTGSKYNHFDI